jgi:hypothetical protein
VVPLVASRVSLPDELRIVPLERVLPPTVFVHYRAEAESALLRPADELLSLNASKPLHRPASLAAAPNTCSPSAACTRRA